MSARERSITQMIAHIHFFFQAEDGIRVLYVTGVQTCALPIWVIAFTGSTEVGKSLLRAVGETDVKAISLELGGKSPQVVLGDVRDVAAAAQTIGWGIFYNGGQTCNAGSRLVVHRSVRDELVERIAAIGRDLAPGEPLDP